MQVYQYHGSARRRDLEHLESCDLVVTTYATLGSDHKKSLVRVWEKGIGPLPLLPPHVLPSRGRAHARK